MADEHTPYLDPDYTPDTGDAVQIFVKEGIGTVFLKRWDVTELKKTVGGSVLFPGGPGGFDKRWDRTLLDETFTIEPLEITETV